MIKKNRPSLASAPFYAAVLVILTMTTFIATFWAYGEYARYRDTIQAMQQKYLNDYHTRLTDEMENVFEFIEYKKLQANSLIEEELRDKVHIAYTSAAHLYSLYKKDLTPSDLKTMIVESLRPIRWNTGLGYFFIGNISDGRMELHADRPVYENTSLLNQQDFDGKFVIRDMIDIAKTQGAGLYRYKWSKPEAAGEYYPKISFVKYFEPYDWFIGAGIYVDNMRDRTQGDVLTWVKQIRYGLDGQVICFRNDGTTLVDFEPNRNGRPITTIYDSENTPFGSEMLIIGLSEDGEGFVRYVLKKGIKETPAPMMSYVRMYRDWNWVFATNISMAEMEEAVAFERQRYRADLLRNVVLFLLLLLSSIAIVLVIAFVHTLKIRHGIKHFVDFFQDAAEKKIKLQDANLQYSEFEVLGKFANQMVDDRILKEQLLRRNELRLDTLLQLGMMSGSSTDQLCNFALQRILEITSSQSGYIAFVSDDQSEITLLAVKKRDVPLQSGQQPPGTILHTQQAGCVGHAVVQSKAMVVNRPQSSDVFVVYQGMETEICRHIDVPVRDGAHVNIVGGVCNKEAYYSENDVRQLLLVLEGLWHVIVKYRAEMEMGRLKNLLKGINDSLPSVLISVDRHGHVVQWNLMAEQVTSISAEEAYMQPLAAIFPRLGSYLEDLEAVFTSGVAYEKRNVPYVINGKTRYETITICPLLAENDEGAVLRIDDVTEKVHIEDLMIQSEKMLSVGGLAAGMAHEINNPLAGILQNLQVVQNRLSPSLPKNIRVARENKISLDDVTRYIQVRGLPEMFDSIHESARRAANLVMNMLSFSRKSDSVFSSQDICSLMDKTILLASNDYDLKKNFDFRKMPILRDYDGNMPLVPCEATNIQQVFLNILKNAAYALAGQDWDTTEPKISIRITHASQVARIEIEDNGPGMDEATRKRIFEPFFTTKPVGLGTGLGLSLSFFIIHDQHNGTLEVHSEKGGGAQFVILLPLERLGPLPHNR